MTPRYLRLVGVTIISLVVSDEGERLEDT
jgi:hypothetical protein